MNWCFTDQLYIFLNLLTWKQPAQYGGVYVMLTSENFKVALVSNLQKKTKHPFKYHDDQL